MKVKLLALCVAALLGSGCAPKSGGATAIAPETLVSKEAPPPAKDEQIQARQGFVWIQGHWSLSGARWNWTDGHWERERQGMVWLSGRWEKDGAGFHWVDGRWEGRK